MLRTCISVIRRGSEFTPVCRTGAARVGAGRRQLHASTNMLMAKKKQSLDEFDPFAEEESSDSLFDMEPSSAPAPIDPTPSSSPSAASRLSRSDMATVNGDQAIPTETVAERSQTWKQAYEETMEDLKTKPMQVRTRSIRRLVLSAQTKDEWQATADLADSWRVSMKWSDERLAKRLGWHGALLRRFAMPKSGSPLPSRKAVPQTVHSDDKEDLFSEDVPAPSALVPVEEPSIDRLLELSRTVLGRRHLLFEALHTHLMTQPKRERIPTLIALSLTPEDLQQVRDVIAVSRDACGVIDPPTADLFLARCVTLGCPELAVTVLAHRPKYGVDIPSQARCRSILHGLLVRAERPGAAPSKTLDTAFILAGLAPMAGLPAIAADRVASSLLIAICAAIGTDEAKMRGSEVLDDWKIHSEASGDSISGVTATEQEWEQRSLQRVKSFADSIGVETKWLQESITV